MEPIIFSNHAEKQMDLRGADKEEVEMTILEGKKETAKHGKFHSVMTFDFKNNSPVNNK